MRLLPKFILLINIFLIICIINTKNYETVKAKEYYLMPTINDLRFADIDLCKIQENYRYCAFEIKLSPISNCKYLAVWNLIEKLNSDPRNYRHDIVNKGRCVPNTLQNDELVKHYRDIFDDEFRNASLSTNVTNFYCNDFSKKVGTYETTILSLVISGTIFIVCCNLIKNDKNNNGKITKASKYAIWTEICQCFSVKNNWADLFRTDEKYNYTRGIRFLLIMIVVQVHALMAFQIMINNTMRIENSWGIFYVTLLGLLTVISMQIFFYFSGFFMSLSIYIVMDREPFSFKYVAKTLLKRYLRLTPAYVTVILISSIATVFATDTPYIELYFGREQENCRNSWWTNILYINNIILPNVKTCVPQSWFLAADFQLHIISLFILSAVWIMKDRMKEIFSIALLVSIVIPGVITYAYRLDPLPFNRLDYLNRFNMITDETYHKLYAQSYTNMSAYFLGLIMGYIFHKGLITKPFEKLLQTKWPKVIWYIMLAGVLIILMVITVYLAFFYDTSHYIFAVLFAALHKPFFTCGFIIFIWGLHQHFGEPFLRLLEWKPFAVLGKLTYSVYLTHLAVVFWCIMNDKTTLHFTGLIFIEKLIIFTILSYILALYLYFTVEAPSKYLVQSLLRRIDKTK